MSKVDDFRHTQLYSDSHRADLLREASQARLVNGILSGHNRRILLTLTVILLGMIAWWGR